MIQFSSYLKKIGDELLIQTKHVQLLSVFISEIDISYNLNGKGVFFKCENEA